MANKPLPVRKPVAAVRRFRPAKRAHFQWSAPPALIAAGFFVATGGAAWWFLRTPPAPAPVAERGFGVPELDPAPTASPMVQSAISRTAPVPAATAVVTPSNVDETRAGPTPEPVAETRAPVDFQRLLVLDAMGSAKPENLAWQEESWQFAKISGQWDGYRDLLARSFEAMVKTPADLATVVEGKYSSLALIRHAFLTAVPEAALKPLWEHEENSDFIRWLLETPAAMQPFTAQLSRHDNAGRALTVWATIAAENPEAKTEYRDLAIACALVFDQTVKARNGNYEEDINPVARYTHFRQNDQAGKLSGKIKKMTAGDLIWVVGVPVTQAELDWAIKKTDYRQKSWGVAYEQIKYDMEKAVTGKNSYDEYTFAEILKKGGICADRSYFTAWTACAHAIPAAILGGDGPRGPHAWMTWMADEGDWKSSGRIGGYPAGSSRNPQTGESISEEEFLRFNDPKNGSPGQVLKALRMLWLGQVLDSRPDLAVTFIAEAVKTSPRLAAPSAALLTYWMDHCGEAPVEAWTALLRDLRKNFRDSASLMKLAKEAEEKFVFVRQDVASTMKNLRREAKKLDDTSSADAGVSADPKRLTEGLRRQAEVMRTNNDPIAIRSLYKKALADFGDNPATFKALAKDFFAFSKADPALAAKACHELESACRRNVGRGQGGYFDVLGQNSAWLVVADCYRAAGDAAKADLIKRDCESRIQMAKKQAL